VPLLNETELEETLKLAALTNATENKNAANKTIKNFAFILCCN